jgi:twitching motility protein PilT
LIPQEIKPLEALGIPAQVSGLARLPRGFVLVTGPTGSGKSTTLASLVDLANREREDHIMTVEDPIEFLHSHKRCLVNQREVGEDTRSFANALKHVLRQDPDIILVGELRDLETISIALTAAETGHLVFATLHTQDAPQTVDRMIDVFPTNQQQQIRVQLAGASRASSASSWSRPPTGPGGSWGSRS